MPVPPPPDAPPIEYYADPLNPEDWNAAFDRAQQDARLQHSWGLSVQMGPGIYEFGRPLSLVRGMHVVGSGGLNTGTVLSFPNGTGIVVEYPPDNVGGHVPNGVGTVLERVKIYGPGPGGAPGHGLTLHGAAFGVFVCVDNFHGDGVHILGDTSGNSPEGISNANGWHLMFPRVGTCTGHGIYVAGGDSNQGVCIGANIYGCAGWGIWDNSFIGSHWYGCQVDQGPPEMGAAGSYRATNAGNGYATFVGCYVEGSGVCLIQPPALVVGGTLAGSVTGGAGVLGMAGGKLNPGPAGMRFPATGGARAEVGGQAPLALYNPTYPSWPMTLEWSRHVPDWWSMVFAHLDNPGPFLFDSTRLWTPNALRRGWGDSAFDERVQLTSARPSGTAPVGTRVFNAAPAPGQFLGWVMTTAGWKGFGAVEP